MIRHSVIKTFDDIRQSTSVVYFGIPVSIVLKGDFSPNYIATMTDAMEEIEEQMTSDTAKDMFSNINPRTNRQDVNGDEVYAGYIPKAVIQGVITPQTDSKGTTVFNGEGTITIAEVLDGFNAIENGANSDKNRVQSLDNISGVNDYFNEGYNLMCKTYSSVFFNLYKRNELFRPITRLEFAYLTVLCSGYFKGVFESKYPMGISFNWLRPNISVQDYSDWEYYTVSLVSQNKSPSHNIKHYKGERSVTELLSDIKTGRSAIPLPMFMSMVELGVNNLFPYEEYRLEPLRQLTRGEFTYCIVRLMKGEKG